MSTNKDEFLNTCENNIFSDIPIEKKKNERRKLEYFHFQKKFLLKPFELISFTINCPKVFYDDTFYDIDFYLFDKFIDFDSYINDAILMDENFERETSLSFFNYNKINIEITVDIEYSDSFSDNVDFESQIFEKIIRILPSRAELNTNKFFPFIIFQNIYLDTKTVSTNFKNDVKIISLPFNFAIPNKNITLISIRDLNLDTRKVPEFYTLYNHGFYNNEAYSPSLFENNNLRYIFIK